MAGFNGKGAQQTWPFGQMFEPAKGKSGRFPTPNIAPTGRPIAARFSFFIRYFLVKPTFFRPRNGWLAPDFANATFTQISLKIKRFAPTYPHLACG
jgi:hypothetical protein